MTLELPESVDVETGTMRRTLTTARVFTVPTVTGRHIKAAVMQALFMGYAGRFCYDVNGNPQDDTLAYDAPAIVVYVKDGGQL